MKPMLASPAGPVIPFPMLLSPKLDGIAKAVYRGSKGENGMKNIDDEILFKLVKDHLNKIYHKRKDKIIHAGTGLTQPAQWYRDFAQEVIDVALKDLVMDVRCEGCGYMTHHREHMGCVRAAKQHTHPAPSVHATSEPVLTVEREPDYWSGGHFYEGSRPHINPTKVWSLPIGTELYTHPAPSVRAAAEIGAAAKKGTP